MSGCRSRFSSRDRDAVSGLDIDPVSLEALNAGRSYIHHIPAESIAEQVGADRFSGEYRFRTRPGGGGGDHLRADAPEQEPGTGHL